MNEANSSNPAALEDVTAATTRVPTGLLLRNGISSLRILSETQFHELLKRQEARVVAAQASSHDGVSEQELARAYENRWAELKNKHEKSLGVVEARMDKLSRAFNGLNGLVGKLDDKHGSRAGVEPLPGESQPPAPVASRVAPDRQKVLLRQLLLNGEASKA